MRKAKYFVLIVVVLLSVSFSKIGYTGDEAIQVIKQVADRIIRDTSFQFKLVARKRQSSVRYVDFRMEYGQTPPSAGFAYSNLLSEEDRTVRFGLSSSGPIKIWVNGRVIYQQFHDHHPNYRTVAYNFYEFPMYIDVPLKKGINPLMVKLVSSESGWIFHMAPVHNDGKLFRGLSFSTSPVIEGKTNSVWLISGPYHQATEQTPRTLFDTIFPPENGFKMHYTDKSGYRTWMLPKTVMILEDVIEESAAFKKHSYFEWRYANGATMLSLLSLADHTAEKKYDEFVKRFCNFTLENMPYFRYQYHDLHVVDGFNQGIFRKSMLDDTGAPSLPFAELLLRNRLPGSRKLNTEMAEYVSSGQVRLPDNTLCRPEPVRMTIWGDDLFMSVPFLLRMARITGDTKYYDDAAHQVVNFYRYLKDEKFGLLFHGWFANAEKPSVAFWGRANGWVIWSASEALLYLPTNHKNYQTIQNLFVGHMKALIKYQHDSGLWYQVLDQPDSWLETSCSAMFVLGLARGITNGWLGGTFRENALRGWRGVASKIEIAGIVKGICQGTGIGYDFEFYHNRKARDNDPRGLGAVITAGIEISKLEDYTGRQIDIE